MPVVDSYTLGKNYLPVQWDLRPFGRARKAGVQVLVTWMIFYPCGATWELRVPWHQVRPRPRDRNWGPEKAMLLAEQTVAGAVRLWEGRRQ